MVTKLKNSNCDTTQSLKLQYNQKKTCDKTEEKKVESTTRKFKSEYNCSNNKYKFKVFHEQIYTVSIIKKNSNLILIYIIVMFLWANVPF